MRCIRAVGDDITFQIRHNKKHSNELDQGFYNAFIDAKLENKKKTDAKYNKIKYLENVSVVRYNEECEKLNAELDKLNREWLKENSKKYGITYSEIRRR